MPKLEVTRSIDIKANQDKVAEYIRSFKEWQKWSPWLVLEPQTNLDFAKDGSSYSWDGELIGKGSIHLDEEVKSDSKDKPTEFIYKLKFLKPFKSESDVKISLVTSGLYTQVIWRMNSSLPFFLTGLKSKIVTQCGMDFDRGLKMLKDLVELGHVHSITTVKGQQTFPAKSYLILKGSSSMKGLPKALKDGFTTAKKIYDAPKIWTEEQPIVIYDKFDTENELCVYRIGVPVKFKPDMEYTPAEFEYTEIPEFETHTLTHEGAYRHLGNAWALGMNLAEKKKFKLDKEGLMLERYLNRPEKHEEKDYLVEVHLPIA